MIVRVVFFAAAKQRVGAPQVQFALDDDASLGDLRSALAARYPALGDLLNHCTFSIDRRRCDDAQPLYHDCEVGCLPPSSGG